MKVTTKKTAAGTYSFTVNDGEGTKETVQTQATTALGARVQGLRYAAKIQAIAVPSTKNWNPSDVTLEG